MRIRKYISFITAATLALTLFAGCAAPLKISAEEGASQANASEVKTSRSGEVGSKEEVIYANLTAQGKVKEIYAVNVLNVIKEGLISDYGNYTLLKNLTQPDDLEYDGQIVTAVAAPGRFYYQGNMAGTALPWKIDVSYSLGGNPIDASKLAGASGELELQIKTSKNEEIDSNFYDNYLLQITVTLDTTKCTKLLADGATLANSGTDKQVTFTVMPKKDALLSVKAEVKDFAMEGIQISAVPFSMNIDLPDTSELTSGLTQLNDAIISINDGMTTLSSNLETMEEGARTLAEGGAAFHTGLSKINNSSKELTNASRAISGALSTLSGSLQGALAEKDLSSLTQLPSALAKLSSGLTEISTGLSGLNQGYSAAYTALDSAIAAIPEEAISEESMQKLVADHPTDKTIVQLVKVYTAAQTVKATYHMTAPAFEAVNTQLLPLATSINTIASSLDSIAAELSSSFGTTDPMASLNQLTAGLELLNKNYKDFDKGLTAYTSGVSKLTSSFSEVDTGMTDLSDGISKVSAGVTKLNDGTTELKNKTGDIPGQVTSSVDALLSDYNTADYQPISFVSDENKQVASVQFVIHTEGIAKELPKEEAVIDDTKETIWSRLLKLFQ